MVDQHNVFPPLRVAQWRHELAEPEQAALAEAVGAAVA
jgi:hypothetical protein